MTSQEKEKLVCYWIRGSDDDWSTTQVLFKSKKYVPCLFFCHLCLEKILKAHAVKETGGHAPFTHNLSYLAGKTSIPFEKPDLVFLEAASEFNIGTRYPEDISKLYRKFNKNFAKQNLDQTGRLRKWIKSQL